MMVAGWHGDGDSGIVLSVGSAVPNRRSEMIKFILKSNIDI